MRISVDRYEGINFGIKRVEDGKLWDQPLTSKANFKEFTEYFDLGWDFSFDPKQKKNKLWCCKVLLPSQRFLTPFEALMCGLNGGSTCTVNEINSELYFVPFYFPGKFQFSVYDNKLKREIVVEVVVKKKEGNVSEFYFRFPFEKDALIFCGIRVRDYFVGDFGYNFITAEEFVVASLNVEVRSAYPKPYADGVMRHNLADMLV